MLIGFRRIVDSLLIEVDTEEIERLFTQLCLQGIKIKFADHDRNERKGRIQF